MRTKNLNLKKKIAFIASVAMIASTAAYLPAEVTNNIFNNGIIASAEVTTQVQAIKSAKIYTSADNGATRTYLQKNGSWNATGADDQNVVDWLKITAKDNAGTPSTTDFDVTVDAAKVKTIELPNGCTDKVYLEVTSDTTDFTAVTTGTLVQNAATATVTFGLGAANTVFANAPTALGDRTITYTSVNGGATAGAVGYVQNTSGKLESANFAGLKFRIEAADDANEYTNKVNSITNAYISVTEGTDTKYLKIDATDSSKNALVAAKKDATDLVPSMLGVTADEEIDTDQVVKVLTDKQPIILPEDVADDAVVKVEFIKAGNYGTDAAGDVIALATGINTNVYTVPSGKTWECHTTTPVYAQNKTGESETFDFSGLKIKKYGQGVDVTNTYDPASTYSGKTTENALDTFDAYIKIDGKYVGYNSGKDLNDYKLVNSIDDTDYPAIRAFCTKGLTDKDSNGVRLKSEFEDTTAGEHYTVKRADGALELPYFADAKKVTIEFRPKKKAASSSRSISSIDIELNENGIGRLGKQHEFVVGMSYDSTFDESSSDYKGGNPEGEYEIIDFSNFVVFMRGENKAEVANNIAPKSITDVADVTAVKSGTTTNIVDGTAAYVRNNAPAEIIDKEDIEPDSYDLMKINGHFARVIKIQSNEILEPGSKVDITTAKKAAWDESGSKDGKITVVMGGNTNTPEYGVSALVTNTSNGNKEYFVYVVKNKLGDGMTDEANSLSTELEVPAKQIGGVNSTSPAFDLTEEKAYDAKDRYKVEKEVVKENVNSKNYYVTQYTIYNNEIKNEYVNNSVFEVNFKKANTFGTELYKIGAQKNRPDAEAYNTGAMIVEKTAQLWRDSNGTNEITQGAQGNIAVNDPVKREHSADTTLIWNDKDSITVQIKKTEAGKAESEIIKIGDGANADYVKFVFTNEYDIKVDYKWEDNKEDLTKVDYDEKVEVAGQTVTKPDKINRLGFDFDGWTLADGTTDIFRSDDWNEQYHDADSKITPNAKLQAKYTGLRSDIVLDANGGMIVNAGASGRTEGSKTAPAYFHGISTKEFTKSNFFSIKRLETNEDLGYRNATAYKKGFKFLGWSTDPNATKKMTVKELEDAFPGEDKALTLYAVYEAEDNIGVNFKQIMFDRNGVPLDTDGKANKYDTTGQLFSSATGATVKIDNDNITCIDDAKFNVTPSITVTGGEKIGTLPVPYEKGYTFEGWYAKTWNNTMTAVEYVKVTEDTVVDEKLFAKQEMTFGHYTDKDNLADDITLYAKFVQNTYNITFDIGEGSWENSKIAKPDGKIPATMTYSGCRLLTKEDEKLGFRRPDGEVISVDDWKQVANPHWGSNEVNEFARWTINGKGSYSDLKAVANALVKRTELGDVVIKAVYEDTESNKSKIFLDANEGDFYGYLQINKDETTKVPKKYQLSTGADYTAANTKIEEFQKSGIDLKGGTAGIKVSSKWNIDGNGKTVEETQSGPTAMGYTVARAGYDFTGWYTDRECTKKYTFDKYPAKGTEIVLYAGWEKSETTEYRLAFDLYNGDKSKVTKTTDQNIGNAFNGMTFQKTFMGVIDDIAYAKKLKVQVQDGTGTQSTYKTYVFDPELSKNLNDTSKKIEYAFSVADLKKGLFTQDRDNSYTTIYGRFVEEGYQSEEKLVAPTNVRVVNGVVSWVGSDVAVKYQIKKIVNGKVSYSDYTDKTTFTIKNVPDQDYQVAVIAVDKNNNKLASIPVDVIVASSELAAPTNVKVSAKGEVTWDAAKGAVKYQVLKVVGNTKAYTAKTTDLKAQLRATASDYSVYVIAFDANGKSKRSAKVAGKAFSNGLGIVTDAKYAADTKTVTWTAVDNAVKYQVLKVVNGKKFYGPYVTGTSYTFKNVPDGAFAYYVIAKDAAGNSTRGTMNKVTNHPSVTDVKLADDNKTVTFKAVEGATGYQLCKIVPGKNPAYSAISTNTTITFKNACTSGTQVYVLAFFDEAHKDASYSETIIVK
jgi:uncharacterized repeat protein (TIGR02543 family)